MYFCDDQGSCQRRQNIDGQKEQPRLCTTTLHFYVLEFFRLVVFLYREQKKKGEFWAWWFNFDAIHEDDLY